MLMLKPTYGFFFDRNEKNQLLLGIRRANRPQTVMPSSVLSSDSMHLGLLAAAAHAAATNSRFTIFYNPRYGAIAMHLSNHGNVLTSDFTTHLNLFPFNSGLVHQNLSYLWQNISELSIILEFLLVCALECFLKQKNQVFVGMFHIFSLLTVDSDCLK